MKPTDPQLRIRVPKDVKAFIEKQSAINRSSQNSEIIRCIRERMSRTATPGPNAPTAFASRSKRKDQLGP
jgi:hypothetical protein